MRLTFYLPCSIAGPRVSLFCGRATHAGTNSWSRSAKLLIFCATLMMPENVLKSRCYTLRCHADQPSDSKHAEYASDCEVPHRERAVNRHALVPLAWRKRETMADRLAPEALAYFLVPVRHIRSIGFHGREECAVLIGPNANGE